jgi:hypothetical protein
METKVISKRRIINIKKPKTKLKKNKFLSESLKNLKDNWVLILEKGELAHDFKFLTRFAINITQLYHEARIASGDRFYRSDATKIQRLLSSPFSSLPISLIQAAKAFSVQHPKDSELSGLLSLYAKDTMRSLEQLCECGPSKPDLEKPQHLKG